MAPDKPAKPAQEIHPIRFEATRSRGGFASGPARSAPSSWSSRAVIASSRLPLEGSDE